MAEVDYETLSCVAQIHVDDLTDLRARFKGKGRDDGSRSDEQIALEAYAEELAAMTQLAADHRMALSLSNAVRTDLAAVQQLEQDESIASRDHEIAAELARQFDAEAEQECGQTQRPPAKTRVKLVECVACTERFREDATIQAPCPDCHRYCQSCVRRVFVGATKEEGAWPPRCDQVEIPLDLVRHMLTDAEIRAFESKREEFSTQSRLYCSNPRCSTFLGPRGDYMEPRNCSSCHHWTCGACSAAWHRGRACSEDSEAQVANQLKRDYQYQSCPACHRVVELEHGCNHMTCKCSAQFCYVCSAEWKTCPCPQWAEEMLHNEAERRVQDERPNAGPQARADAVQRVLNQMRGEQVCVNHRWQWRNGAGTCQSCARRCGNFLFRCNICRMAACIECKHNRL